MRSLKTFSHFVVPTIAALALASCSGSGSTVSPVVQPTASATPITTTSTFSIRAVHGSPDAGPVDIYLFASSATQPATPLVASLAYPGITAYGSAPVGTYTIVIDKAGTTTQVATETVTGTAGGHITVAVAGQVAAETLQLQNFIEPTEVAGTSAAIVHHASPAANAAVSPIGVGTFVAQSGAAPAASSTIQGFTFSLAAATATTPGFSGPATSGSTSGGEYFVSPIPATVPSPLGFAAGAPGTTGTLASVATFTTLSGLATVLNPAGPGDPALAVTLSQDTANTVPAGAHLSVFAVDSITSAPAILIGTLDP